MEYSTDMSKVRYVNEFKELLKKAHGEHRKTPTALAEEHVGVDITQDTMNDIIDNVSDRIESEIDDVVEDFTTNTEITNNELRELRGILDVKGDAGTVKLEAIKVESEHWKKEGKKEGDTPKGILTTVIMTGRSALKRGAQAASKFGKAVANLAKKFGPILSAIGTLVSKVLTLGAQGILFLAQNLWILVLALTYFIYNEYMSRRRK
jgi:hypothetical protein